MLPWVGRDLCLAHQVRLWTLHQRRFNLDPDLGRARQEEVLGSGFLHFSLVEALHPRLLLVRPQDLLYPL